MADLPRHIQVTSAQRVGKALRLALAVDTEELETALRRIAPAVKLRMERLHQAMEKASDALARSGASVRNAQARTQPLSWERKLIGWEARMFVRGGMADIWATEPADVHRAVRDILRGRWGRHDRELTGLLPHERSRLATALLRGYLARLDAAR